MSVKKFIAPNITIILALSLFWLSGVETVIDHGDE